MNTSKFCLHCADVVATKQIGRKIQCTKCGSTIEELPIDAVLSEPTRPAGFGAEPSRTKRRGMGW